MWKEAKAKQEEWARKSATNEIHSWMIADITLTGYTCILFMLHRARTHNANPPAPDLPGIAWAPMILSASRRIIEVAQQLILKCPHIETVCLLFGTFRVNIACAYIVSSALETSAAARSVADLQLLEKFTDGLVRISVEEKECAPLVQALRSLNTQIRMRTNGVALGFAKFMST